MRVSDQHEVKTEQKLNPTPMSPPKPSLLLLLILLPHIHLTTAYITPTLTQLRTLISFSHSLSTRVATLRLSRGDTEGAKRAHLIASRLNLGLSGPRSWISLLSLSWDYLRNYSWRNTFRDAVGFASEVNELMGSLNELTRLRSDSDRAAWLVRNYEGVLRVFRKLFRRLLSVFSHSGPLRELVEALREEMEGDFLKDCLEVGANDLNGLVGVLKDLASQYTSAGSKQEL